MRNILKTILATKYDLSLWIISAMCLAIAEVWDIDVRSFLSNQLFNIFIFGTIVPATNIVVTRSFEESKICKYTNLTILLTHILPIGIYTIPHYMTFVIKNVVLSKMAFVVLIYAFLLLLRNTVFLCKFKNETWSERIFFLFIIFALLGVIAITFASFVGSIEFLK